jgi:HAD superfamily hydrolase (TIGR01509 family)
MIRAVISDCFGILYTDPVSRYQHDGKTPEHIVAALHDIHDRAAVGDLTQQGYIQRVARLLQKPESVIQEEFFGDTSRNDDALAYIGSLRPLYKTALLSNAGEGMLESRFDSQELHRYFDVVVQPYKLHTAKPDPAILRWTCEQLGVPAGEVVLIDDSRINCDAAQSVGMRTILYHELAQTKSALDAMLANQ